MSSSKKLADLLVAAREGGAPTDADRARVRTEIHAKLAAAAVSGLAVKGSAVLASKGGLSALFTKSWKLALAAKFAVMAFVSGAVILVATLHLRSDASRSLLVTTAGVAGEGTSAPLNAPAANRGVAALAVDSGEERVSRVVSPETTPLPDVDAAAADVHAAAMAPPASSPAPAVHGAKIGAAPATASPTPSAAAASAPVAPTLADELTLVRQGRDQLERGDAPAALATVDEYERRFPQGTLAEEARVVRVLALCSSGRRDEGRALARALEGSVAWGRARTACEIP